MGASGVFTKVDEIDSGAPTDISYAQHRRRRHVEISRPTPGKSNSINAVHHRGTTPTVSVGTPAPLAPSPSRRQSPTKRERGDGEPRPLSATAPYTATPPVQSRWRPWRRWAAPSTRARCAGEYAGQITSSTPPTARDGDACFLLPQREYGYPAGYQPPLLLINEVVSRNDTILDPDEVGIFPTPETPDWTRSTTPAANRSTVEGLLLTNHRREPLKFCAPAGAVIPGWRAAGLPGRR